MKSFIGQKSEIFALRIVKLYKHLSDKKKEFVLSKQVLRSGTSIGANLAESDFSFSKKRISGKSLYCYQRMLGNIILAKTAKRFRFLDSGTI